MSSDNDKIENLNQKYEDLLKGIKNFRSFFKDIFNDID
jgi:hypothetical protein